MTSATAIHDRVLHLSLPDWRTALKRRVKRPKRPSWWTVFCAGICLITVFLAVVDIADSEWLSAAAMTIDAVICWQFLLKGRQAAQLSYLWWSMLAMTLAFAGVFA